MSRSRRGFAPALACTALIGLGGCSTPAQGPPMPAAERSASELRDAAVRAAEQTAVTLTSIDASDPEADYERLLATLTGPARQEWEQRRAGHLAAITSDALTSQSAAVQASGVAAFDPAATTATVLVAVTAMVSTKQDPTPQERQYRLRMSLIQEANSWKVSQLQFVA